MTTSRNLLTRGNGKLGEAIYSWSIPAIETCPGRSNLCETHCYARNGNFRRPTVQDILQLNLDAALQTNFEARIVKEIRRRGIRTLRVHVSGDFFDPCYAMKWVRIARRSKDTTFFAYTRSYRLPEFADAFTQMAALKNWRLWLSIDSETGIPETVPANVQLAYLQTTSDDDPGHANVVFRVASLRGVPATRIGLAVVCPTESGQQRHEDTTCTSCKRCYR